MEMAALDSLPASKEQAERVGSTGRGPGHCRSGQHRLVAGTVREDPGNAASGGVQTRPAGESAPGWQAHRRAR